MNNVTVFNFESTEVRTIVDTRDNSPWFVLKDVLVAMGSTTRPAIAKASIEEVFGKGVYNEYPLQTAGGKQNVTIINEAAATFLVSRSNTATGKAMNRWIHSEVLPSIRKNGGYIKNQENMTPAQILANAMVVAQNVINEQQRQLTELTPKAEYHDKWMVSKGSFTTTEVAKQLGISAIKLNKFLREQGIKFKNSDLPIAGFESWFKMVDRVYENASTGDSGVAKQCRIKPEGAKKIVELWEKKNAA